jgi:DNA helicase-2/ATP-dependent DNA helicase PcrA
MSFIPSAQQQAFFTWIKDASGSLVLEAVAGAGKSTTLLEGTARMEGYIFLGAYGKAAADDLKEKAREKGFEKQTLRIGTIHSQCSRTWAGAAPDAKLDEKKVPNLVRALAENPLTDKALANVLATYSGIICKMVSLGKGFLMGVPGGDPATAKARDVHNVVVWDKLGAFYSAWEDLPEDVHAQDIIPAIIAVFEASARMCMSCIDFDDQIYAPLRFNARFFKQDWVLGDEWQDANPARREAVRRMLKPGGRAVFCGDSRQAIYGFTGAGSDSLDRTAAAFSASRLPLTVTYRCPKAVVAYVHQWVSHIEAHPDAPEGVVRTLAPAKDADGKDMPWFLAQRPEPTDAILCRYNKPLVDLAFAMLRNGIACKVEGRDIGKNLVTLATRWKVTTLNALQNKLEAYRVKETEKAGDNERKAQDVADRVDTLMVFVDACRAKGQHSLDCVVAEINALFADNVKGVTTLCSGHKSKGREWGRVYWLQAACRTKRALQPWEQTQEDNISYVIGTRVEGARGAGELILVPEGLS